MNFYEKLKHAAQLNRSLVCVGLDPDLKKLPACLAGKKNPIFEFNKAIIDATRDWVCCYKPQIAYYAGQGAEAELKMTIDYIREQAPLMPVILDAKRSDIGSTAEMYAREAFEQYNADAVTVNPYMGFDTLKPFLDYEDRGVVILCRTSNPNSGDLQNLMCDGKMVYEHVAELARDKWNYNGMSANSARSCPSWCRESVRRGAMWRRWSATVATPRAAGWRSTRRAESSTPTRAKRSALAPAGRPANCATWSTPSAEGLISCRRMKQWKPETAVCRRLRSSAVRMSGSPRFSMRSSGGGSRSCTR